MGQLMKILYESSHLLALHKPAGWTVERSPHHLSVESWALEYVREQVKKPFIGIIHRLDRPVSGVLLLAKKKIALKQLNEQFRLRKVRKTYLALVEQVPPVKGEVIRHWLIKDQKEKKAFVYTKAKKGTAEVRLHYRLLEQRPNGFLLEIHPYTGKYHQIRAQLAAIGCPILGDERYGSRQSFAPNAIALHAYRLAFHYPFLEEDHTITAENPWLDPS